MLGMGMGLVMRPEQRLEQRLSLRLSPQMRLACLQATQLRFDNDMSEGSARDAEYLRKLLKLDADVFVSVAVKDAKNKNNSVAMAISEILQLSSNDVALAKKLGNRAIDVPDVGMSPSDFLWNVFEMGSWVQQFRSEEYSAKNLWLSIAGSNNVAILGEGVELGKAVQNNLVGPKALFLLMSLAMTHGARVLNEATSVLPDILPDRKIDENDVYCFWSFISDTVLLCPTFSYWSNETMASVRQKAEFSDWINFFSEYPSVPVFLQFVFWDFLENRESFRRFCELASDDYVTRSTDNKRALVAVLHALRHSQTLGHQSRRIVTHVVDLVQNSRQLVQVCLNLRYFVEMGREFPFDVPSADRLIKVLNQNGIEILLRQMGFSEQEEVAIETAIKRLDRRGLFNALIRLFAVYEEEKYEHGKGLVRGMLLRLAEKEYSGFRYSHDKTRAQLEVLTNTEAWKENLVSWRHVGDVSNLEFAIQAIKELVPALRAEYSKIFVGDGWEDPFILQELFNLALQDIKAAKAEERNKAIERKVEVEEAYVIITCINELERLDIGLFLTLEAVINKTLRCTIGRETLRHLFFEVSEIYRMAETARKKVERIVVRESDDAFDLLNIGVKPVQTCQRWTEPTSYNKALLAYVLDGNKKVFFVTTSGQEILARAVVRILPFEVSKKREVPMLVIERPYATRWSDELGAALLQVIVDKAGRIASENDGVCALGFPKRTPRTACGG